jgi:4'-phosphopantetheinyl transferase EntD
VTTSQSRWLPRLLPAGVESAEGVPTELGTDAVLFEEEWLAIARAVSSRRQQYAATRHLARDIFGRIGVQPQPVLNRQDRSPIWPVGFHGTITHTEAWCGVAIASETLVAGVGIDAERAQALDRDVVQRVITQREWQRIEASGRDPLQVAALWFSAKESVYKCVFPTVQRFIGFSEVEVSVDFAVSTFTAVATNAELRSEHGRTLAALSGRFDQCNGLWITTAVLSRSPP